MHLQKTLHPCPCSPCDARGFQSPKNVRPLPSRKDRKREELRFKQNTSWLDHKYSKKRHSVTAHHPAAEPEPASHHNIHKAASQKSSANQPRVTMVGGQRKRRRRRTASGGGGGDWAALFIARTRLAINQAVIYHMANHSTPHKLWFVCGLVLSPRTGRGQRRTEGRTTTTVECTAFTTTNSTVVGI